MTNTNTQAALPQVFDLTEARAIVVDAIRRLRAAHAPSGDLERKAEDFLVATNAAAKGDELWDQTLRERDRYHEVADELAQAIAKLLGVNIGEHSSANCPWDEALDAIAQASTARKEPHNGNDTEPRDPESFGYLDARGDDTGQGLDSYWKWGFAAGWNDHKKHAAKERAEVERLRALVNTPTLHSFRDGVVLEAAHQRERWGADHDAGKAPADWFWLVGYLAGKALQAQTSGNTEKALHHTISTAAALANWHAAISGEHTAMRPGINPAAHGIAA